MKRLKANQNFISKYMGKAGKELTFNEFRKYVVNEFTDQINEIPGLMEQMADMSTEGPAVVRLYHNVFTNLVYELDHPGSDTAEDIEFNLKDNYMHDYFIDMKSK